MKFSRIYGHDLVKEQLLTALQKNRIPSAYLFLGADGIGKSSLVREFAQMMNCRTQNSCLQCDNCRMMGNDLHPDFLLIEPSGQFIRIKQIQELIEKLSLKPAYAEKRVVLVKQANRMNQESANCFLKILEEPPLDTLIVLTTTDENLMLETILSRCQRVHFAPLERSHVQSIIEEKYKLNREESEFVLNYSRGRIREDFINHAPVLFTMREQVLNILCTLTTDEINDHSDLVEQWVKKDLHFYFLEMCSIWFRDFIYIHNHQMDRIINLDMMDELKNMELPFSEEQLEWCFDLTIETELAVRANAAKSLALASLLIQLKQIFAGSLVI